MWIIFVLYLCVNNSFVAFTSNFESSSDHCEEGRIEGGRKVASGKKFPIKILDSSHKNFLTSEEKQARGEETKVFRAEI